MGKTLPDPPGQSRQNAYVEKNMARTRLAAKLAPAEEYGADSRSVYALLE